MMYVIIGAVIAIVVAAIGLLLSKKKKSVEPGVTQTETKKEVIETIQLICVERQAGSSKINKLETDEEVAARLQKLSKEEFIAAGIDDKPWTEEIWMQQTDYDTVEARSIQQLSRFYAFDNYGHHNEKNAAILRREFKTLK